MSVFLILLLQQYSKFLLTLKARIFLLVDLGNFFFRFRVEGTKKKIKLWKWPVNWSFSELFFSELFFFNISIQKKQ